MAAIVRHMTITTGTTTLTTTMTAIMIMAAAIIGPEDITTIITMAIIMATMITIMMAMIDVRAFAFFAGRPNRA